MPWVDLMNSAPAQTNHFMPVIDPFGRRLRYLRVSVTDRCNLSCHYCNPAGPYRSETARLSWDDLDYLISVAVNDLGIEAIRLTGGEPTVRPGLADFIARINRHRGLTDISMTTNGIRLDALAPELARAGLRRVSISIDSLDHFRYAAITRGGSLARCLEGIAAACGYFDTVKLNIVALRDFNMPNEIETFIEFCDKYKVEFRVIELMPIFDQKQYFHSQYISATEIQEELLNRGIQLIQTEKTGYGPAESYQIEGTNARIGFISQISETKCDTCNKLRISADGAIKPCLLSPEESSIVDILQSRNRKDLCRYLRKAFVKRPLRYDQNSAMTKSLQRGMQAIGG